MLFNRSVCVGFETKRKYLFLLLKGFGEYPQLHPEIGDVGADSNLWPIKTFFEALERRNL